MWVGRNYRRQHHEHDRRSNLGSVNQFGSGAGDFDLFIYSDAADSHAPKVGVAAFFLAPSLINGDLQILRNVIDFPEIQIDMDAEDELTLEQKHRLWAHLMAFMRTREHQWLQYQNGVLDQETWAAYQKAISIALGSERCHAWWKEFGAAFDTTFVERVNAFLGEQPHYALHQRMLSWK